MVINYSISNMKNEGSTLKQAWRDAVDLRDEAATNRMEKSQNTRTIIARIKRTGNSRTAHNSLAVCTVQRFSVS